MSQVHRKKAYLMNKYTVIFCFFCNCLYQTCTINAFTLYHDIVCVCV